jgi:hypothetical protein
MAIQSMARVYAGALTTLVLDSELQKLSIKEPLSSIISHIYCSGWTTRGWTLQEGNLAKSCHYALEDGTIDLEATLNSAEASVKSLKPWAKSNLWQKIENFAFRDLAQVWRVSELRIWDKNNEIGFAQIWNQLVERATGQAADVPAIMANLMRIRASDVLDLPPEERVSSLLLSELLLSESKIPIGILFQSGSRHREFGTKRSARRKDGHSEFAAVNSEIPVAASANETSLHSTNHPQREIYIPLETSRLTSPSQVSIYSPADTSPPREDDATNPEEDERTSELQGIEKIAQPDHGDVYIPIPLDDIPIDTETSELASNDKTPAETPFSNRWVPLSIEGDILSTTRHMVCREHNHLDLETVGGIHDELKLLLVQNQPLPTGDFLLTRAGNASQTRYVEAIHNEDTVGERNELISLGIEFCLLVENRLPKEGFIVQGAQLIVVGSSDRRLTTIFDCPVRIMDVTSAVSKGKDIRGIPKISYSLIEKSVSLKYGVYPIQKT